MEIDVESLTIHQRLNRLGYKAERVEVNGQFRGMRVMKDGVCIHDSLVLCSDSALTLCRSLGG